MDKLPMRNEVPAELTWDLTLLYKNSDAALADGAKLVKLSEEMMEKYKGRLNSAKDIAACAKDYEKLEELIDHLANYAELVSATDYTNEEALNIETRVRTAMSTAISNTSFVSSEIPEQSEAVLKEAITLAGSAGIAIKEMLRGKPYRLHAEAERVLAAYGQTFETPYTGYTQIKMGDMVFPDFEANGKKYPLGYSLFEDDYEYEKDAAVRHAAFEAFSSTISKYKQGTAAMYNAEVQKQQITAKLRGFKDVYDYLLFDQHVEREMYDRQIDLIMEHLAPHMRKYAKLLQRIHGLPKMTFADLKIAVDPEYDPKVTIEESKKYIKNGLSVLGEDYVSMIEEAYRDRWVDFAKNFGKCTGGFCCSPYRKNSFILLSWNDRMADVFTLAHELGHAGHFRACGRAQSVLGTDVSTYIVEAPSTMNELIMANYMVKTSEDKRFRRWVLSCMVSNTYYHNFVTHLLEGAYSREVYRIVSEGGMVSADTLTGIFKDVLTRFWGDAVEIDDNAALTWMRQPHYYMGLYSYTYSAGLTVATEAMRRIEREGAPAVEDWKTMLRAGSTLDPKGLAKLAGVDISTDEPLLDTIEYIGSLIDEICELTEEIEGK